MRYLTAGESHGKQLTTIIEGIPARMPLLKEEINESLLRRQQGHGNADLNGALKYGHRDMRNVLERSSARETTMRVAAGAVAKVLLKHLGIEVVGYVKEIAGIQADEIDGLSAQERFDISDASPVRV